MFLLGDGNPGVGSKAAAPPARRAVEKGWPQPLEIEEHSHADLANAYVAGASRLPFASAARLRRAPELAKVNPLIRSVTCPFTGGAGRCPRCADVSVIHAQKADRRAAMLLWGHPRCAGSDPGGEALHRHRQEIVDELDAPMNACVLPSWALGAVVPGARRRASVYAHGYYERDNRFYQDWDPIARDRESFTAWIDEYIQGTEDFGAFQAKLAENSDGNYGTNG